MHRCVTCRYTFPPQLILPYKSGPRCLVFAEFVLIYLPDFTAQFWPSSSLSLSFSENAYDYQNVGYTKIRNEFFSFFLFSFSLPLFVHNIETIPRNIVYAFCSLFTGGRVFLYPFATRCKKSSSPVTRTIFKEIYKLPDKLCLRVGSFSNFVVQAAIVVPLSTNVVTSRVSRKQPYKVNRQFSLFTSLVISFTGWKNSWTKFIDTTIKLYKF